MGSRVQLYADIRHDARVDGLSIRELARKHGVHRRTVRQALAAAEPPPRKKPVRTAPRLDPYKPAIDEMLTYDLTAPRKQHHTATRILARLRDEHGATDLSYSTVRDYVRVRRTQIDLEAGHRVEAMVPQDHAPGAEAEVDFGEVYVILDGVKTKCRMFVYRLSHSGTAIHRVYPTGGQEAFHALGGIPTRHIRYDNTRRITGHANTIGQDHHAELPHLAPLPADDFDPGLILHPRVDRSALITVRMVKYSVPAHLIGQRVRVSLRASCVVVFEGRTVLATHPRLGTRGVTRVELDHYLEVLRHKPGAFPGSTALAQARAAGAFTAAHDAFWAAARKTSGDVAGTQALIDVLLLHRSLPSDAVIAGITSALSVGAIGPDVVAVEARRHATTHTPAPASQTRGGTVVNLPPRRPTTPHQVIAHLPEDTRPLPTVTAYDELLCRRQPDPAPAPAETHHHTPTGTP